MIDYGEKPSNQTQLPFADGYELMEQARKWIRDNPESWRQYLGFAEASCRGGHVASPNFCLQAMRNFCHVSVRNGLAPAFARIAMEDNPDLSFRLAKSKVDGFCGVTL